MKLSQPLWKERRPCASCREKGTVYNSVILTHDHFFSPPPPFSLHLWPTLLLSLFLQPDTSHTTLSRKKYGVLQTGCGGTYLSSLLLMRYPQPCDPSQVNWRTQASSLASTDPTHFMWDTFFQLPDKASLSMHHTYYKQALLLVSLH